MNDQPTPEIIKELTKSKLAAIKKKASLGMADVGEATVDLAAGKWVVCRAPQDPSCARLLDVAVSRRDGVDPAAWSLAILEPPSGKKRKLKDETGYLHAYQDIAWRAFRVAFVLDVDGGGFSPTNLVQILDRLDEVRLPEDEVEILGLLDRDRVQIHRVLRSMEALPRGTRARARGSLRT
jgi:hypothetical protein